ncbi:MAG: alpha/beta hydrolase, partial [bacterium]
CSEPRVASVSDMRKLHWIRYAIVCAIFSVIAPALSFTVAGRSQNQQAADPAQRKLVGTWEGTLDAGAMKVRLVLKVVKETNGSLKATLDSPDQGATDLPFASIANTGPAVRLEMTSPAEAIYEGNLSSDGSEISGQWQQGGQKFPLNFKRAGKTASSDPNAPKLESIDAGGHKLNLLTAGHGTPTVILEAGFGAGIASWTSVHSEIAKFTRVVAYDRAGLGQSGPGPKPRTAKQFAIELHTALKNAGINPPYVLVGHSMGGITVRVFADMYPRDVAGLVLVDPSQEGFNDWIKAHPAQKLKEADAQMKDASEGIRAEAAGVDASYEQARESRLPAKIPVILLVATQNPSGIDPAVASVWLAKHKEWAKKVPQAKVVLAEKSSHMIQFQQPELVIDAIKEEVNQANSKKP